MSRHRTAERMLEASRSGEKLSTSDRRHVVAYLMSTEPDFINADAAEWLQVSERTIRVDKRYVREQMAKHIKEDDVANVVADIAFNFQRQIRDIETSKGKCKQGTDTFLKHCVAAMELELKKTKAFQDLGFLPKNLGNMTKEVFEYAAVVIPQTGAASSRPVESFDADTQLRLERQKQEYLGNTVDAEFVVAPALLPESTDDTHSAAEPVPTYVTNDGAEQEKQDGDAPPSATAPETSGTD